MYDIMVDIETESTQPNAIILSIAAVKFNAQTLDTVEGINQHTFYRNIIRADAASWGLHSDPDTLKWWSEQAPEARAALEPNQVPLKGALLEFAHFCTEEPRACRLWAKDPDFDAVILRSAFRACDLAPFPVPFWLTRSVRTIQDLAYPSVHDLPKIRVGTHHNALDDCASQALMVQHCHKQLGLHPTEGSTAWPVLDSSPAI